MEGTLVPIYKNKYDIQNCVNCHGIELMSHNIKLRDRGMCKDWEKK